MSVQTPAPYDINFCFPVCELENDRIKLTPFISSRSDSSLAYDYIDHRDWVTLQPTQHADLFFQGSSAHPELYQHIPFGPYDSADELTGKLIYGRIQHNPGIVLFAILDKTKTKTSLKSQPSSPSTDGLAQADMPLPATSANFAGIIGYLNASPVHVSLEIGFVIILPPFQRTHVTTNAVGLLIRYALDLPTAAPPGLGLRRVQWQTNEFNDVSIRVAERMGMRQEGRLRWDRVFEGGQGKVGNGETIRKGDPRPGTLGRHTVMLAICWDDWEDGGRERVTQLMNR